MFCRPPLLTRADAGETPATRARGGDRWRSEGGGVGGRVSVAGTG